MVYQCEMPNIYPFYIIKDNLCIIPVHNIEQLNAYVNKEGMEKTEKHLYFNEYFSMYNSIGPIYINAKRV